RLRGKLRNRWRPRNAEGTGINLVVHAVAEYLCPIFRRSTSNVFGPFCSVIVALVHGGRIQRVSPPTLRWRVGWIDQYILGSGKKRVRLRRHLPRPFAHLSRVVRHSELLLRPHDRRWAQLLRAHRGCGRPWITGSTRMSGESGLGSVRWGEHPI